jgi:hypothetical protein
MNHTGASDGHAKNNLLQAVRSMSGQEDPSWLKFGLLLWCGKNQGRTSGPQDWPRETTQGRTSGPQDWPRASRMMVHDGSIVVVADSGCEKQD